MSLNWPIPFLYDVTLLLERQSRVFFLGRAEESWEAMCWDELRGKMWRKSCGFLCAVN